MNLTGVFYVAQTAARHMMERGSGVILQTASTNGVMGYPYYADYNATKAGVIGMTRDLASLLSPLGVHVNSLSPGGFDRGKLPKGFVKDYSDRTPLGRMGRDETDLRGAVLFLASRASDYVTGHNLVVDGGFSIWQ